MPGGFDALGVDPAAVVGEEGGDQVADVVRATDAAERRLAGDEGVKLRLLYANRRHLARRVQVFMTWLEGLLQPWLAATP